MYFLIFLKFQYKYADVSIRHCCNRQVCMAFSTVLVERAVDEVTLLGYLLTQWLLA